MSEAPVEWQHSHDVSVSEAKAEGSPFRVEAEARHKPLRLRMGYLTSVQHSSCSDCISVFGTAQNSEIAHLLRKWRGFLEQRASLLLLPGIPCLKRGNKSNL